VGSNPAAPTIFLHKSIVMRRLKRAICTVPLMRGGVKDDIMRGANRHQPSAIMPAGLSLVIYPVDQGFGGFNPLAIAVSEIIRTSARQKGEFDQFFHHIDHPVVKGRGLHAVVIVKLLKRLWD
jgi:hypothetical protein